VNLGNFYWSVKIFLTVTVLVKFSGASLTGLLFKVTSIRWFWGRSDYWSFTSG